MVNDRGPVTSIQAPEPDGPVDVSAASPDDARSDTDGSTGVAELPPKLTEYPEGAP